MISKEKLIGLVCLAFLGVAANFSMSAADSRAVSFNDSWKFALTDGKNISAPDFDDSKWRNLNLPHDWAIEGDFSEKIRRAPVGAPFRVVWAGTARHSLLHLTRRTRNCSLTLMAPT